MWFKRRLHAPGPTPIPEEARQKMARTQDYHRTPEFSQVLESVRQGLRDILCVDWPLALYSSSGTGGMEAAVHNLVSTEQTPLVVEHGKFGRRWTSLLHKRGCEPESIDVPDRNALNPERVEVVLSENPSIDTVFATAVETSTLVRHPIKQLAKVTDRHDTLLIVDAISAIAAEHFQPEDWGVDAVVGGSQKGLMAPPGLAFLTVTDELLSRSRRYSEQTYFDLGEAVDRQERDGQTPWTPSIPLVRAMETSVDWILNQGLDRVRQRHRLLARACRAAVKALGLELFTDSPANVGTPVLLPESLPADTVREQLDDSFNTFVPGGRDQWTDSLLRIGHLGHVDAFDILNAVSALELVLARHDLVDPGTGVTAAQKTIADTLD